MTRPRFTILFAEEDRELRASAAAALDAFALTVTPLHVGSVVDPGAPALLIWTANAMRRDDLARALLADVTDVVVWRPGGAPAPRWIAQAYPVGPEMPLRTLEVMARLAIAEGERRARIEAPKPPPPRKRTLGLAAWSGVALVVVGVALLVAMRAETHAAPVAGLRGLQ